MIAVDTNVLVYAHRPEDARHEVALDALKTLALGSAAWALPVFVIGEFLRVVTHPRIASPASTTHQALSAVEVLLGSPSVRMLVPGPTYWATFRELIPVADARGNLVFDAQIAAVCLEHGATTIVTADRDFHRFPGLAVQVLG